MTTHSTPTNPGSGPWLSAQEADSNLTRSQFLIWTGQQLDPHMPLYNIIHTWRLRGELDAPRFLACFQRLVETTDALRIVVEDRQGVPWQRVRRAIAPAMELVDLSAGGDPGRALRRWQSARARRRLQLDQQLFDAVLVRLAADEHVWYLNQHHLITDAWSTSLICARMVAAYSGTDTGLEGAADPPLFSDYAARERQSRDTAALASGRRFWQKQLSGPPSRTDFYGARAGGPGAQTHRVRRSLGSERSAALRALAAMPAVRMLNDELSQFRVFAALLTAVLSRVSGFGEMALGCPVHNRSNAADRLTPGLFIELFPLFMHSREEDSFNALLQRSGSALMAWLAHARAGLSTPESNHHFDVVLNFLTAHMPVFPGLQSVNDWVHSGFGDRAHKLRIQVHDFDHGGTWTIDFDFNRSVFDSDAQQRFIRHFFTLLDAVLADQEQLLQAIDLSDPRELSRQLGEFNAHAADYSAEPGLLEALSRHAQTQPGTVAIRCGEQQLDYAQLVARVAAAAASFRAAGAAPGRLVAVALPRGPEAVISLLGVLEAGAAFLPLDPAQPTGRLVAILNDVRASGAVLSAVVSGSGELEAALAGDVTVMGPPGKPEKMSGLAMSGQPVPEDRLAYVIYTSGSSGTPKGVMVPHRGLHNYLHWARSTYCPEAAPAVALHTSLAVDLTITSMLLPLLAGGQVVIYPDLGPQDLPVLRVIEEDAVDLLKLTPSHLALVREMGGHCRRIRTLVLGGEMLRSDLASAVSAQFPQDLALYNEYGPTEATVGCMVHRFNPRTDTGTAVPIGRPIANMQVFCLDGAGRPVATGLRGELCVAGPGVASGYLGRAELTAQRFVPMASGPSSRLYRTGDAARWSPDGQLELLGRMDRQVKLRGHRVEPGEVEAALNAHAAVQTSVVQLLEARPEEALRWCARCGMPSHYPGITFDAGGVCSLCLAYARHGEQLDRFFGSPDDLQALVNEIKANTSDGPDAIVLVSGGKDSTYMLHQLANMGLNMLALTLDNGFLSGQAMDNARRSAQELNIEHLVVSTPHMNEIFADSLARHSNVCHGCFKTIYTLALQEARSRNISAIFTGLSRGQIFETRLDDMFRRRQFDVGSMEQSILDARKVYHRMDDAVGRLLRTGLFDDDAIFEQVRFVDFYRYVDVPLDEVYRFLDERAPWVRPTDTGRSTNCRINDAGIYVHRRERGFHNYALPYSWDVRLGHKTRAAALHELNDDIDVRQVREILNTIGFAEQPVAREARLVAWYQAEQAVPATTLRAFLAERLPEEMLPAQFVHVAGMPLAGSGKLDLAALPPPDSSLRQTVTYRPPASELEQRITETWSELLNVARIGVDDSFFDVGGRSLTAIQMLARLRSSLGIELPMQTFFRAPTIAALSEAIEAELAAEVEALSDEALERLLGADAP